MSSTKQRFSSAIMYLSTFSLLSVYSAIKTSAFTSCLYSCCILNFLLIVTLLIIFEKSAEYPFHGDLSLTPAEHTVRF